MVTLHVKPACKGEGVVVRLYNTAEAEGQVVRHPPGIVAPERGHVVRHRGRQLIGKRV